MSFGADYSERTVIINELLNGRPTGITEPFRISDTESIDLVVYNLPLTFPKYRIQNTRTLAHQIEYIQINGLGTDHFNDPESEKAQHAQSKILKSMIDEKDLHKKFSAGARQQNAVVLTLDGFTISGNRRLCSWRILYDKDSDKYSHFHTIKVCIYEHTCTDPEIDKFEALQETDVDIQSNYNWFTVAMKFKMILDRYDATPEIGYREIIHNYKNSAYITKKQPSAREDEISKWIAMFEKAKHIMESEGKDLQYIIDNKYAFEQWVDSHRKSVDDWSIADRKIFDKWVSDILLSDSKDIPERKYAVIKSLNEHFEPIKTTRIEKNKLLSNPHPTEELLKIEKATSRDDTVSSVTPLIEQFKNRARLRKDSKAAIKHLGKAHGSLKNAESSITEFSDLDGADNHITEIDRMIRQIKAKCRKFSQ
ncbi:hypothetical protein ACFL6Q_03615 [Candidatus Neomarinimicrobiota bacterium]